MFEFEKLLNVSAAERAEKYLRLLFGCLFLMERGVGIVFWSLTKLFSPIRALFIGFGAALAGLQVISASIIFLPPLCFLPGELPGAI